jgi:ABC-2 type transport system permease protein
MRNVWTITSRELKSLFVSPVAYVVSALFLVAMGYLFSIILITSRDASLRGTFNNMIFVLLLLAPALTMKLLADEQRMGTIELLLTSPIHDWQVVVGKFLGSLILFVVMFIVPTLFYVLILYVFGPPDWGPIASGYLGIVLLGASFLAIGVFTSSLTQNQVIAYFAGLVLLLLLWIADAGSNISGAGPIADALSYLSISKHYDTFFQGIIDTSDIVYSLSVIVTSLFLATQVLQTRRWR